MSAEDPVITVSNETSEPGRVDSAVTPPSEHLATKDVSTIPDSPPPEPMTQPPTQTAQTAPEDTLSNLPNHDANIPSATPPNLDGVEAMTLVSVELSNFFLFLCYALRGCLCLDMALT